MLGILGRMAGIRLHMLDGYQGINGANTSKTEKGWVVGGWGGFAHQNLLPYKHLHVLLDPPSKCRSHFTLILAEIPCLRHW